MGRVKKIYISALRNIYFIIEKYRFIAAKRKADRLHFLDGKKYWVIKLSGRYQVLSTLQIKDLKQKKIFKRELDLIKLQEVAAYNTNEKNKR